MRALRNFKDEEDTGTFGVSGHDDRMVKVAAFLAVQNKFKTVQRDHLIVRPSSHSFATGVVGPRRNQKKNGTRNRLTPMSSQMGSKESRSTSWSGELRSCVG